MPASLEDTVAFVTGASSGIGRATARELHRLGASVALIARRADRLDELVAEFGERAVAVAADVTERGAAEDAVARTVDAFGRLDVVVNNAGVMLLGPIEDADVDDWDRMIAVNLSGLLYVAKAALPHLLASAANGSRGVTDLVNVSSVAGRTVRQGSGVYNATKHGVGAFSESLRQEVTQRNLRVSLIEPGAVDTELPDHLSDGARAALDERFANAERLTDADIAESIAFIVTRPRRVAINEILIRPTDQQG